MSKYQPRFQVARVPVPEALRLRIRELAKVHGKGKASRMLSLSWDYFESFIDDYGVATNQSIAGVTKRLDRLESAK